METKKFTKEDAEAVAVAIGPIVEMADITIMIPDIVEKMIAALDTIRSEQGRLEALPFPATMNKGDDLAGQAEVLKAVIALVRARQKQREKAQAGPRFMDDAKLRELGIL